MIDFLPIDKIFTLFGFIIPWWAVFFALGALSFFVLYFHEVKGYNLKKKFALKALVHFLFWGVLGLYVYRSMWSAKSIQGLFTMRSRDSFGVVFGIIAMLVYLRAKKLNIKKYFDMLTIPLLIFATITRIGCMLIADERGIPAMIPWAIQVKGSLEHPVGLYYFLVSLLILFVIIYLRKKHLKDGNLFLSLIILYCSTRVIIDYFRAIPAHNYLGLSIHQVTYSILLLVGITLFIMNNSLHKKAYYIIKNFPTYLTLYLFPKGKGRQFFKLYTYFRWIDDIIDDPKKPIKVKKEFLDKQKEFLKGIYSENIKKNLNYEENCMLEATRAKDPALKKQVFDLFSTFYTDIERLKSPISYKELILYSKKIGFAYVFAIEYYSHKEVNKELFNLGHLAHIIHLMRDYDIDRKLGYKLETIEYKTRKEICTKLLDYSKKDFLDYKKKLSQIKDKSLRKIYLMYFLRFEYVLRLLKKPNFRSKSYSSLKAILYIFKNLKLKNL